MIKNFFLVGVGGGIGSMLRYGVQLLYNKNFPAGTLLVNIAGSLLIGVAVGISLKNEAFAANWKLFIASGICGGFTTFSAFTLENILLLQQGKYLMAAFYIVLSMLLGLAAVLLGVKISGTVL